MHKHKIRSWHSIDGIVTRLWAWRSRIWILGKASFYFPQTSCLTLKPTKPPIQWCWGSFPEVKQLGHEVDHSPVSRAEVMNECRYTSTPLIHLQGMAWVNFTFTFYISKIKYSNFTLAQWYTECPRRNVPDFRRVFFMLKYTDITQNTYVQSWTVTEIMAREVWNFDSCYTLIDYQIHIKTCRNMWFL